MSDEQTQVHILDLVEWIDGKQTELFQKNDSLKGSMRGVIIGLVVFFFVIWLVTYEYTVSSVLKGQFSFNVEIIVISNLIPALAIVIAGLSLFAPHFEKNEIEVRYERALDSRKKEVLSQGKESKLREFTDNERPFLKALIEIRSKNEGFTLKQLYDLDKTNTVFAKEKLLERLCK